MKYILLLPTIFILMISPRNSVAQGMTDSVTFEQPTDKIVIDNPDQNLWQIGAPQKAFFNSAHTGTKAILTDTVNFYPPNDTSSFIYIIRNPYTLSCYTLMEFWHKYDMDTIGDKGIIEASYDGGSSWVEVADTSGINPWMGDYFMWDADYHESTGEYTEHKLITSGKSDGWIKSTFYWQWYMPVISSPDTIILNPDSLMIRFTFISDNIVKNKEGWMIDDIVAIAGDWAECSGIDENPGIETVSVYPNPFSSKTTLQTDIPLKNADIMIFNSLGRMLKQLKDITGSTVLISSESLPDGIYFLLILENDKPVCRKKLVVCRN